MSSPCEITLLGLDHIADIVQWDASPNPWSYRDWEAAHHCCVKRDDFVSLVAVSDGKPVGVVVGDSRGSQTVGTIRKMMFAPDASPEAIGHLLGVMVRSIRNSGMKLRVEVRDTELTLHYILKRIGLRADPKRTFRVGNPEGEVYVFGD